MARPQELQARACSRSRSPRRWPRRSSGSRELIAHFAKPDADYPSNKIPKPRRTYVGDYDHLARISEWVATDQEEDDERRALISTARARISATLPIRAPRHG